MQDFIASSRARRVAAWLAKKAAMALPGILLGKLSQALETLLDARTPAWKRAVAAAVLIEVADLLPTAIPASIAVRYLVLRAVFEAGSRPEPHSNPVEARR